MFTGLVQHVGRVGGVRVKSSGGERILRLRVEVVGWSYAKLARRGDSVCVSGVCLTIARIARGGAGRAAFEFDVIQETLEKTRLGALHPGDAVNLEHAATAATFLGGHIVQGHVDGVGMIDRVKQGADWRVWIELPARLERFIVDKGSVCLDGVSLTVAGVRARRFGVALIPETLEKTTLAGLKAGDAVNIEVDVIAKMVVGVAERMLARKKG